MMPLSVDKTALRAQMRALTSTLDPATQAGESRAICTALQRLLVPSRRVLLYAPLPGEVDIWPIFDWLLEHGIEPALPQVDWERETMAAASYDGVREALIPTGPGLVQPADHAEIFEPASLDVVVAPGLAFDASGGRLGRGGGYYDRFLAGIPERVRIIGVGFDAQVVDAVPREPHDRVMDVVVTGRGVITPEPATGGGR